MKMSALPVGRKSPDRLLLVYRSHSLHTCRKHKRSREGERARENDWEPHNYHISRADFFLCVNIMNVMLLGFYKTIIAQRRLYKIAGAAAKTFLTWNAPKIEDSGIKTSWILLSHSATWLCGSAGEDFQETLYFFTFFSLSSACLAKRCFCWTGVYLSWGASFACCPF